ncbi:MAG: hypothetical protein ACHQF0_15080, partial [Chitinophagales bacterium]
MKARLMSIVPLWQIKNPGMFYGNNCRLLSIVPAPHAAVIRCTIRTMNCNGCLIEEFIHDY